MAEMRVQRRLVAILAGYSRLMGAAVIRELNELSRDGLIARRNGALIITDIGRFADLVERVLEE